MAPPALTPIGTVAVFSRGIARLPHLAAFLDATRVVLGPAATEAPGIDAVAGWGLKPSAREAAAFAAAHRLPYLHLEDGFLRSVGLGVKGAPPLSLVIDRQGIYYDSTRPSDLEALLNGAADGPDPLADPGLLERSRIAMARIVEAGLSKYNEAPPGLGFAPDPRFGRRVLVVDQTAGDMSVVLGGVPDGGFPAMLAAALSENPDAEIIVKTHPDVIAGKKKSCLGPVQPQERVRLVTEPIAPHVLLEAVDRVYVGTSQLGFEALLAGKRVTCFGLPFYAGWGLTEDRVTTSRRTRRRSLPELFAAAYLLYPRYVDPDDGRPCAAERVIEHLALQRRRFVENQGRFFCFGFSLWKRNYVRAYLRSPGNRVVFARRARAAERQGFGPGDRVLVWGLRGDDEAQALATRHGAEVWRMEDGFLRSVGLGSDLTAPASLVIDSRGIYYDPTAPSDLEHLLATVTFDAAELAEAQALRQAILAAGISKYNLGETRPLELARVPGQRVILVPGQVEDDASIARGCRDVRTNLGLIRAVRERHPEAFLIFKPHPDVVSGNREGAVPEADARALCDLVIENAAIAQCLDQADEVHTMTSLVGFEALLRGLKVSTYGLPFYAGWGLTDDRHVHPRRQRTLTLDELTAGALLRYPRYLNPTTGEFTTAAQIVKLLVAGRDAHTGTRSWRSSRIARQWRKLTHIYKGLFDVR